MIVCPLHWYFDPTRLAAVVEEMRGRGAPVLRGCVDRGRVFLREGTHRIRAALELGLVPTIAVVPWWRSAAALERAGHCARRHGLWFPALVLEGAWE